jgi:hypothetical protein
VNPRTEIVSLPKQTFDNSALTGEPLGPLGQEGVMKSLRATAFVVGALLTACTDSSPPTVPPTPSFTIADGTPTTVRGVSPTFVPGNISGDVCSDRRVNPNGEDWFGFKVDPPVDGSTSGIDYDVINDGKHLNWTADPGVVVQAVVVKGGPNTYVYYYNPPNYQDDQELRSPLNEGGNIPQISHFEFCFGEGEVNQKGALSVIKFYDANVNGINDVGELLITGWAVNVTGPGTDVDGFTPFDLINLDAGDYTATEGTPIQLNWIHTTPTSVTKAVVDGQTTFFEFGNVCLGAGGGRTPGFWSNKNGENQMKDGGTLAPELALLAGLNLRNANGSGFDPASYSAFRTWLLGGTATNMAYMLSVHLAAMALNVEAGFVSGTALVFVGGSYGFLTINALMAAANTSLGLYGLTLSGHAQRADQELLKNALDNANNNTNFVQPTPCPFSFPVSD